MAILVVGISMHLPLTYGTCNLMVATLEMVIGKSLDSKHVTWVSWVAMVVGSYLIDFTNLLIPISDDLYIRIIYMLVGVMCYCLGLAIEQTANIGYSNLDVFIFGIKKALNSKTYHGAKWIVDAMFIVIGYFLGSKVGIGTVLLLGCAGILIEKFKKLVERMLKINND